jgi:tetratricopeptide (TPR) repeat protein
MCFWGEAIVLGPHVNMGMMDESVPPAWAALTKAKALASRAAPNEQALIEALSHRYAAAPVKDRAPLDKAYADAMGRAAKQFPDDIQIATLYAEAVMDLSPWNYWKPGGVEPNPQSVDIVPTLERVLAKDPNHAGAIHLYIHAVEASDKPERAQAGADRLAVLIPGAGHIVHMPSHIYYRVGRYLDALNANKAAVAVDESYIAAVKPTGPYPLAYYPHNVHFLLAAAQLAGDSKTALEAAAKLRNIVSAEAANAVPMVQPDMAAPYWANAMFDQPETVLGLPVPENAPTYVKAMRHYARGLALIAEGRGDEAQGEIVAIQSLSGAEDLAKAAAAGIPGPEVLTIATEVLAGRMAMAKGDPAAAIPAYQRAAELQESLAYMEPPYWYYPVRQSLGAALLLAGRPDEAEQAFQAALKRSPNSGWALFGLMEAAKARGDKAAQQDAEARLSKVWTGDRSVLDLKRL